MDDSFKTRGKALEEDFFHRKEKEALERLAQKERGSVRLSPITGKPLVQKAIHGIVIDQCADSQGIWLDAGELEQIVEAYKNQSHGMIESFFSAVLGKK